MTLFSHIKNARVYWIIGGIVLLAMLFYFFQRREPLTISLLNIHRITHISSHIKNDSAHTKLAMVVQNNTFFRISISAIYLNGKLNGKTLIKDTLRLHFDQRRRETDTVQVPIVLPLKEVKSIINGLPDCDSTDLLVEYSVFYRIFIGSNTIHLKKHLRIPTPVTPEIKLRGVEYKNYNFTNKQLYANIDLEVINNGRLLDLELTQISYKLEIENTAHSTGIIDRKILIKPRSRSVFSIPVVLIVEHPFKTSLAIIRDNDRYPYKLEVHCKLRSERINDDEPMSLDLVVEGKIELKK